MGEKNRPGYSRDGATKSRIPLRQEALGLGFEAIAFLVAAVQSHLHGHAVVQAEHTHIAFGADPGAVVAHHDAVGLHGGQFHKFLHFPERMQNDIKLLQVFALPCCTNGEISCIMKQQNRKFRTVNSILAVFWGFSIGISDDIYNFDGAFLVKMI